MHGRIGEMVALSGRRDALIDTLCESINDLPACLSHIGGHGIPRRDRR
jgi:hypothetical protein